MSGDRPFADLPAALVEEVLGQTEAVSHGLLGSFREVRASRTELRRRLRAKVRLIRDAELDYTPPPTTCAADGSYAIERLLTADLAAAAAVAMEGLTPPSETRHWDLPHHVTAVFAEVHHEDTATVLRAVMLGKELELAQGAPHDLVMLDGTFTLPVIYFNQALNKAPGAGELACSTTFLQECGDYLRAYLALLRAERSDKNYVALPKYSTRREIGRAVGWPQNHDDRGLLTLLLEPGELTDPMPLERPSQDWHFNLHGSLREAHEGLAADVVAALNRVHIFYYRPNDGIPTLRVEVPVSVAKNPHRMSSVVHGIKHQCATAAILEPYPIYMADRMVKALTRALPTFRQAATQRIAEDYEGEIGEVFFALHGYRSEGGR